MTSYSDLADPYKAIGDEYCGIVRNLSPTQINAVPSNGEWSAAFITHHMADADAFFATRFMRILSEENPAFEPFDEEVFPKLLNYAQRDGLISLTLVEAIRAGMHDLLQSLDESAWSREGLHSTRGAFPLHAAVALATSHLEDHLKQLKEALALI